jgi:hypothetical protein
VEGGEVLCVLYDRQERGVLLDFLARQRAKGYR